MFAPESRLTGIMQSIALVSVPDAKLAVAMPSSVPSYFWNTG
jgi:hypothetical protein